MELAMAALSSLLPKLGSLLLDEYKLHTAVRGEIRFLQAEMESMQAALYMVSNKLSAHHTDDHLVKIWARDLKELCYDIEDSVDAFAFTVRLGSPGSGCATATATAKRQHGFSFRRFLDRTMGLLTKAKIRHHIAEDIQDIRKRVQEVADRRARYMLGDSATQPADTSTTIDPRLPAIFEDAAVLVGTDGPAKKICSLLTRGWKGAQKKLMVVSIVGVGGLGKTTIASLVYKKLGGQFQCKAFVSVSVRPNMKQILSSILRQVSRDACTNAGEKDPEELIMNIREFIMDKRYLIVIDDVWSEKAWNTIKCALIDENKGSRVIMTTRNIDVANFASVDGALYELDPLSYKDSKRLLYKRIFNEENEIHYELEDVTEKILKKCGGVPLAIITIASLLASIPNKVKYEWYGVYNSMGSGLEKDKSLENMREILYLSYSDLPCHLKPCLLYLSMFPEDHDICRDELVRLWVAEGFIDGKQGSNLYDLGVRYFNELVNRSMVQPVDMDEQGSAIFCRVHDMILDLIISLSTQENFVTILEGSHLFPPVLKIRRSSLQGNKVLGNQKEIKEEQMMTLPATVNMSHARSLVVFGDAVQWMPPLSRFSVLRVLSLIGVPGSIDHHLEDLERLQHLRYLQLGGQLVETGFLEGIGKLKLLKTLDVWATSIEQLPASIVELRQLERLLMYKGLKLPDRIGNLTSLQELSVLDVDKSPHTLVELGKLTELRLLTMHGLGGNESSSREIFLQSLSNLGNLRTLNFEDEEGQYSLDLDGMSLHQWRHPAHLQCFKGGYVIMSQLPQWFSSLSELSCLSIKVKVLRQADLRLLGALPMLRFLELLGFHSTTEELVVGADRPFRSLVEFKFAHYTRDWLVFTQGVMPKLQRLKLFCSPRNRDAGGFDIGLENLACLKHVSVKVIYRGAQIWNADIVENMIRVAIQLHPNNPTLELSRVRQYYSNNKNSSSSSSKGIFGVALATDSAELEVPRLQQLLQRRSWFFERTTAGEASTVSNLLNQKEPTVQKRQNKKQQQRRKQVA